MPTDKLTDKIVRDLEPPKDSAYTLHYDSKETGFGVRVTKAGAKSFIYQYRTKAGTPRRMTIGKFPQWTTTGARGKAEELRDKVNKGGDPLRDQKLRRDAATVADLYREFEEEHLSTKAKATQRDYVIWYKNWIKPALGSRKLEEVTYSDVRQLHRRITKKGKASTANRVVAVLSSMFGFAKREQIFTGGNPCQGIQRNNEEGRTDHLTAKEVTALSAVLDEHSEQDISNILRLLIFTGSRSAETRSATWDQFDLEKGIWTKPSAHTKSKKVHRVPLSAPALELLTQMQKEAKPDALYVFPGGQEGHRGDIQSQWRAICKAAGLVKEVDGRTVHKYRMHDLRHTYASTLASGGQSLPIIGALLGHTQAQTTQRYAHLLDDPLRKATESAGAILSGKQKAEVVDFKGRA